MEKLVLGLLLSLACSANAFEVVSENAEAKVMYKGLKNILGEVCSDSRCLVVAGVVGCAKIMDHDRSTCTVTSKFQPKQIFRVVGSDANSLYDSLVKFQNPSCEINVCVSRVVSMECTSYGYLFPDYLCRAEVY